MGSDSDKAPGGGTKSPAGLADAAIVRDLQHLRQFPAHQIGSRTEAEVASALEQLRVHAADWATLFMGEYERYKRNAYAWSSVLRYSAFAALLVGAVILVCRVLDTSTQTAIMTRFGGGTTVPAELGLVFLALTGSLLAIDRFAGVSENWMRYVSPRMAIERLVMDFQLDWERLVLLPGAVQPGGPPAADPQSTSAPFSEPYMALIETFVRQMFEVVARETEQWSANVRSARSAFEQYLRVQGDRTGEAAGGAKPVV